MKNWAMFILLGTIWGSSFLLIKVAVAPESTIPTEVGLLDPIVLGGVRLGVAALCFMSLVALTRRKLPTDRRTWFNLAVTGLLNYAIPFSLIPWGERSIDSGLATVLNATVPLFGVVLAHFTLSDDKISLGKIFGLISGFAGVLLLASRGLDPTHANPISGQLAVIGASFSYALAAVWMRRTLRHLESLTTAGLSISFGAIILAVLTLLTVRPLPNFTALQPEALRAALTLGFFNTFVAYLLFFNIFKVWGVSRTTMVTYLMPPIGLALGAIFEHEPIDWRLIVGAIMVMGGVALANLWKGGLGRPTATGNQAATQTGR